MRRLWRTRPALHFEDKSFDLVFHKMVAEHLDEPAAAIAETARILKPGSRLLFETPSRFYYPMLIANLTPTSFHRDFVRRFGSGRTSDEVFSTRYGLNDRRTIDRLCRGAGLDPEVTFRSTPPGYLRLQRRDVHAGCPLRAIRRAAASAAARSDLGERAQTAWRLLSTKQPSRSVVWIVNQYAGSPRHGMEYRHYYLARQMAGAAIASSSSREAARTSSRGPRRCRGRSRFELIDGVTYCWVALPRYERAISLGRVLNMAAFALRLERLPTDRLPRPDAILVSSPSLFPIWWPRAGRGDSARGWSSRSATSGR